LTNVLLREEEFAPRKLVRENIFTFVGTKQANPMQVK